MSSTATTWTTDGSTKATNSTTTDDSLSITGNLTVTGTTTLSNTLTVGVNDTGYDVKFFGATSGAYMLWDESDDDLKIVGGAGIVQSGAGANTLTGATTFSNTLTVGVDDTGYDVKFFGATSGRYLLWDESDDALELVDNTKLKLGSGDDLQLYHDGSNSYITNSTGALKIATESSGIAITIGHTTSETTIADNLTVTGTTSINGASIGVDSDSVLAQSTGGGTGNTIFGKNAGDSFNADDADYNTLFGDNAGTAITTGDNNTMIGYQAGDATATTSDNTMIGYLAGTAATHGENTIIGASAGAAVTGSNGTGNVVVGANAFKTQGDGAKENVVIGNNAMENANDTSNDKNVVIGTNALDSASVATTESVIIGTAAAGNGATTANYTVAVGTQALYSLTSGTGNIAVGYKALNDCATGAGNTMVGYIAGQEITGNYNTGFGYGAVGGSAASAITGAGNTCIGYAAGYELEGAGHSNVYIGKSTGYNTKAGFKNVAIGFEAFKTAGTNNDIDNSVAIGYQALYTTDSADTDGSVAVGYYALKSLTTGQYNTALGYRSLDATDDGDSNTAVGYDALGANCGNGNTSVGYNAGLAVTGGFNTLIGSQVGDNITSGTNNTMIGHHISASAADVTYEIVIGSGVDASNDFDGAGEETCRIGRASDYITVDFGENATWSHSSDVRIKKDISDNKLGLNFINELRTVNYKKKAPSEYPQEFNSYDANETERKNPDRIHYGFIAQEVKEAMDKVGHSNFPMWSENKDGMQELAEAELIAPLVKAIQELSKEIEELKSKVGE